MREILFRGKRIDNGEWVYGYWVKYKPYASSDKVIFGIVPTYVSELYLFEVDPKTVGQYTGLYDKNGSKIFEGDIINVTNDDGEYDDFHCGLGAVEFFAGMWYVCGAPQNGLDDLSQCYNFEVVGNIYDNPELLEVQ